MTIAEADVILTYHLPCVITGGSKTDSLKNREFRISGISKNYQPWSRIYIYSAVLEADKRAVYQVELSNIEVAEGYEGMVQMKIKEAKKNTLKNLLSALLDNLKTKKEINSYIGKLIDEIKAERKNVHSE